HVVDDHVGAGGGLADRHDQEGDVVVADDVGHALGAERDSGVEVRDQVVVNQVPARAGRAFAVRWAVADADLTVLPPGHDVVGDPVSCAPAAADEHTKEGVDNDVVGDDHAAGVDDHDTDLDVGWSATAILAHDAQVLELHVPGVADLDAEPERAQRAVV